MTANVIVCSAHLYYLRGGGSHVEDLRRGAAGGLLGQSPQVEQGARSREGPHRRARGRVPGRGPGHSLSRMPRHVYIHLRAHVTYVYVYVYIN